MKKTVLALAVPALLATGATQAVELYNDGSATFSVGGRLNLMIENSDSSTELTNNSSRINFNFSKSITDSVTARSTLEYGLGNPQNNNSKVACGDADCTEDEEVGFSTSFFNRLAFIAFDHDSAGSISFGKQWSTYYEVAGATDVFWVYGGTAVGIYGGGDERGTARADESVKYDNSFGNFNLSAQYQFENESNNRDSSYALAASYDFDFGLNIGAAYHVADYTAAGQKDSKQLALAATYATDAWYASVVYADLKDLYDRKSNGYEGVVAYTFPNSVQLYAGFNYLDYDAASTRDTQYILGAAYYIAGVRFYGEYANVEEKAGGSKADDDLFAVGVRYYF
ncbi:porin [Aliagarivorans marinus]|uniref:porin n=1 Tax=Aliagarivorans marinus TaxID=561965 RepID=UPI000414208E|nr:porin [Aliagarivorans marinus]